MKFRKIDITEIEGFHLGNAEDTEGGTGCTAIICEEGAVAGVDVRGGAPATRETDLLRSENTVDKIHAVVLSGGSAFGLEAASGVMRFLRGRGKGYKFGASCVPVVSGAALYDLEVGSSEAFPDVGMGIRAAENAFTGTFESGNHGAGTGATVGKILGMDRAMKSGLGTFACGDDAVKVGAIAAVNALADIYNGAGNIIAGLRTSDGSAIHGSIKALKGMVHDDSETDLTFSDIKIIAQSELKKKTETAASDEPVAEKSDEKSDIAKAIMAAYELSNSQASAEPAAEAAPEPEPEPEFTPEIQVSEEPAAEAPVYEPETVTPETVAEAQAEAEPEPAHEETPDTAAPAESEPVTEQAPQEEDWYQEEPVFEAEPAPAADPVAEPEPEPEYEPEAEPGFAPAPEPVFEPVFRPEEPVQAAEEPAATEPEEEAAPEEEYDEYELSEEERNDMGYGIPFNTTISCLITNAVLTKAQANKLATILHDAYARAIKPVHSTADGDTVFVMSTCTHKVNFDAFAALATDVMQYAIIDGAMSAESAYGLPASKDIILK